MTEKRRLGKKGTSMKPKPTGGRKSGAETAEEEESLILPILLWELQEPFALLDHSRACRGVSQGFVRSCKNDLAIDGTVISEKELAQLWPGYSTVALERGDFSTKILHEDGLKTVEAKCIPLSQKLFLFSFMSPDEADSFFHQQRLQTLGLLAGGVAHDFNNILAGILGHITFLQAVLPSDGAHEESLEAITSGAKKASSLTKQILDFSKFDLEQDNPAVELVELVNSTAPLLRGALTSAVQLQLALPGEKQVVQGSEGKIAQILVNLVINARDAVDQGGKVEVRVRAASDDDQPLQAALEENESASSFVVLEVKDNGAGMGEQVRSRALEPYFSTKGEHGTGLGLATVASITEGYGGVVNIESRLGEGACVQVFLKRLEEHLAEGKKDQELEIELPVGTESVLVVDDEKAVRNVVSMSLRHLGYTVTERSDPREAQELLRNEDNEYDLVVLDMLMPHLSGEELFFDFRSYRPDLPVLIMSGYSEEGAIKRILKEPLTSFIHSQPFTVEDLSVSVRERIDNSQKGNS